ncbi:hypothetical protein [Morganella psychrotolerans]|uniref:hypothetical protein n=1 Tax=Morganella psychrotolerans TaxID=368603 RepID=UPI0009ED9C3F|nr:hypothetical protein [Morganella psychrotolerans]
MVVVVIVKLLIYLQSMLRNYHNFFEPFLGLVEESDGGNSLSNILQSLFHMFNNQVENKDRLIAHILGEEYRDKKYKLKYHYQEHLDGWEEFKK